MVWYFNEPKKDITEDLKVEKEHSEHDPLTCCSVCEYAYHAPSLGDREEVVCTYNMVDPHLFACTYLCDKFKSKYNNLKLVEDKGVLLEYDTETASRPTGSSIPEAIEIGEKEWLEKSSAPVVAPTSQALG